MKSPTVIVALTGFAMAATTLSWVVVRARMGSELVGEHLRSEQNAAETGAAGLAALVEGFRSDLDRLTRLPSVRYLEDPEQLERSLRSFEGRTVIDSVALIRVDTTGAVLFVHPRDSVPREALEALRASGYLERTGGSRRTQLAGPIGLASGRDLVAVSDLIHPDDHDPLGALIAVFPTSSLARPLAGLIKADERSVLVYLGDRPLFRAGGPVAAVPGGAGTKPAKDHVVARATVSADVVPTLAVELRSTRQRALAPLRESRIRFVLILILVNVLIGAGGGVFVMRELRLGERLEDGATRRRDLEAQLRQAQKMESLGTLAGGIAHDFNNILTAIQGHAQLLLESVGEDPSARADVEGVLQSAARASGLTRQLLAFSRKQVLQPRLLDLGETLSDVEGMLRRLIGEHVELVSRAPAGLGCVEADPGQMEQVVLNLVVNAKEAMPAGGRIVIDLRSVDLEEPERLDGVEVPAGRYLCLSVSDDGKGMDEHVRDRLFEPFFTTKPQGTGLGLSTVYGIVQQSGGTIGVRSTPDEGTVVTVHLPRIEGAAKPVDGQPEPPMKVAAHGLTVLLVEDDHAVRRLARRILERAGYAVLDESNPLEALDRLVEHRNAVDLLLTDVVMPEMGGRERAERATAAHPGIATIFMSGYTEDEVMRWGISTGSLDFLAKPFSPADLVLKVEEVLRARSRVPAETDGNPKALSA